MPDKNNSATRLVYLYQLFLSGNKLTSSDILEKYNAKGFDVQIRAIQRDIENLRSIILDLEFEKDSKNPRYFIASKIISNQNPINNHFINLLSLSYLRNFLEFNNSNPNDRTVVNDAALEIKRKIIKDMGENANNLWLQEIGRYNYTVHFDIIEQLIDAIYEQCAIFFTYKIDGKQKQYQMYPKSIYDYAGTLYLICKMKDKENETTFVLHNIENLMLFINDKDFREFDFNSFKKKVFAVYTGPIKHVKIKIHLQFQKYFRDRFWHPSQKISENETSHEMFLEMDVPIQSDFVSWVVRWTEAFEIIEPEELKDKVKTILQKGLDKYK